MLVSNSLAEVDILELSRCFWYADKPNAEHAKRKVSTRNNLSNLNFCAFVKLSSAGTLNHSLYKENNTNAATPEIPVTLIAICQSSVNFFSLSTKVTY